MVKRALRTTNTAEMRSELRDVVRVFLDTRGEISMRQLTTGEEDVIVALASLVCLARSPVERDSYTREIVLVHDSENPARIARQLHKLLVALEAMELDARDVRRIVVRVGLDSIPSPRREALRLLLEAGERTTSQVGRALDLPTTPARRALEELTAHGLVRRSKSGDSDNSVDVWTPTPEALTYWKVIGETVPKPLEHAETSVPEMSGIPLSNKHNYAYDDKTGTLLDEDRE